MHGHMDVKKSWRKFAKLHKFIKLGPPYWDLNQVAVAHMYVNWTAALVRSSQVFSFFKIIPSVTQKFKFQILSRPEAILVCSNPKFIHVLTVHQGQRHENN
jgi:hypothetical protein